MSLQEEEEVLNEALEVCRQLLEQQNWQQAEEVAANIRAVFPEHPQVTYFSGVACLGAGRTDDAEVHFLELVRLVPGLAAAHVNLAQTAIRRGDLALGVERLKTAAGHAPDDSNVQRMLAEYGLFIGDTAAGVAALSRALTIDPNDAHARAMKQAFEAAAQARTSSVDADCIAVISDDPRVREAKLGTAIASQGKRPVLLCSNPPAYDASDYFFEIIRYASPWDAVLKAADLGAQVYHCVAQMKYETCCAFLATRPGPVVCDLYDNVDQLSDAFLDLEPVRRIDRALERSVITRADGLVCRNLESQYAKRQQGVELPGERLFFPEYAWGDLECLPKRSSRDGELHLFFGGTFWNEKRYPAFADCGGLLWFAEMTSDLGVHFHLYPGAGTDEEFEDLYSEYRALDTRSSYFHLNRPVRDMRAFLREASQYDAGIIVIKALLDGKEMKQYLPTKLKYAYGNRVADYVDAGLHYIAHPEIFQHRISRHLGIAIDITPDFMTKQYWDEVKRRILEAPADFNQIRQRFNIEFQAQRLIHFYDSFR